VGRSSGRSFEWPIAKLRSSGATIRGPG
jgi:hypothetical protein